MPSWCCGAGWGRASSPSDLWDAVDEQRLIEVNQSLRVADDIALFRAEMATGASPTTSRGWQDGRPTTG